MVAAVGGDVDRDVPDQPHAPLGGVGPKRRPLALESHLLGKRVSARRTRPSRRSSTRSRPRSGAAPRVRPSRRDRRGGPGQAANADADAYGEPYSSGGLSGRTCQKRAPAAASQSTNAYASGPSRPPGSEVGWRLTPRERVSHIARLFTLSGMAPPRIQIQDVQPQVDCGRFPVKACLGDTVPVSATIFRDGYDKICGDRPVPAGGSATLARGDRSRRRATIASRRPSSRTRSGPGSSASRPGSTRTRAGSTSTTARWRPVRPISVESCRKGGSSSARERSTTGVPPPPGSPTSERHGDVKSPVLRLDVDRERARFGAWYELFPRSWGGFRGVAAVLPDIAALGFDIVYLPPVHPIGETHRKGRNNTERARKGDPGSPWAIGGRGGGHDALHPDLGSDADFDAMVAAAQGRRARARARLRDPVLARSPVARASTRSGSSAAPTARSSTPRTRRSAIRTSTTSTGTPTSESSSGTRCATSCSAGALAGSASSESTTRTRSRSRSGSG